MKKTYKTLLLLAVAGSLAACNGGAIEPKPAKKEILYLDVDYNTIKSNVMDRIFDSSEIYMMNHLISQGSFTTTLTETFGNVMGSMAYSQTSKMVFEINFEDFVFTTSYWESMEETYSGEVFCSESSYEGFDSVFFDKDEGIIVASEKNGSLFYTIGYSIDDMDDDYEVDCYNAVTDEYSMEKEAFYKFETLDFFFDNFASLLLGNDFLSSLINSTTEEEFSLDMLPLFPAIDTVSTFNYGINDDFSKIAIDSAVTLDTATMDPFATEEAPVADCHFEMVLFDLFIYEATISSVVSFDGKLTLPDKETHLHLEEYEKIEYVREEGATNEKVDLSNAIEYYIF